MTRFLVVRHPNMGSRIAVHHFLQGYHGVSLDNGWMLELANLDPRRVNDLHAHNDVFMLPSVFDPRTIYALSQEHNKPEHFAALKKIGINEAHKTSDLAQLAAEFGLHLDV